MAWVVAALAVGCSDDTAPADSGTRGGRDAGVDGSAGDARVGDDAGTAVTADPWLLRVDRGGFDVANALVSFSDRLFVGGSADGFVGMQVSPDGQLDWELAVGGDSSSVSDAVRVSDEVAMVGEASVGGSAGAFVVFLNDLGRIDDQFLLGGGEVTASADAVATDGTDLVIVGSAQGPETRSTDAFIANVSFTGTINWQNTLAGDTTESFDGVVRTASGFVAIGRSDDGNTFGELDLWVVAFDERGEVEWQKSLGMPAPNDIGTDVINASDGNVIVSANTESFGAGGDDAWLVKLDADNGDVLWQRAYGTPDNDIPSAIATAGGDIIVAGRVGPEAGDPLTSDAWIMRVRESDGSIVWDKRVSFIDTVFASAGRVTVAHGGIVVAGFTEDRDVSDWFVLRTTMDGEVADGCETLNFEDGSASFEETTATADDTDATLQTTAVTFNRSAATSEDPGLFVAGLCGPPAR